MKTKKNKKSGFTLVELMVVAIIVAILAAVAIPLMTGNKDRAMATEGQAGCSTIATQIRLYYVEHSSAPSAMSDLKGIKTGDLDGTYFDDDSYSFTATDGNNYVIDADGIGDASGKEIKMTVASGATTWSGDLLGD